MEQEPTIQQAVRRVYRKYFTFEGRARRAEFWWFVLFTVLVGTVLSFVDGILFGTGRFGACDMMGSWGRNMHFTPGGMGWCAQANGGPLSGLFSLFNVIPALALWSRRLHDTDRSFWWMLLIFVPMIGWIVLLIFAVTRGTVGANRFGPDPVTTPDPVQAGPA